MKAAETVPACRLGAFETRDVRAGSVTAFWLFAKMLKENLKVNFN